MKIVIDIPKGTYQRVKELAKQDYFEHDICGNSMRRIANGTPLPKGHGRLIDETQIHKCGWNYVKNHAKTDAPTIIEKEAE